MSDEQPDTRTPAQKRLDTLAAKKADAAAPVDPAKNGVAAAFGDAGGSASGINAILLTQNLQLGALGTFMERLGAGDPKLKGHTFAEEPFGIRVNGPRVRILVPWANIRAVIYS